MGLILGLIVLAMIYYMIRILRGLDKIDKNYKALQEKRKRRKETR